MPHRTPSATAMQAATAADCRHSRQPFDQSFAVIAERRDLGPGPKLLYAKLVSRQRLGAAWTQAEMAVALGCTRHDIWAWLRALVAAGLVRTIRHGLGRPNDYELFGVAAEDLAGTAPRLGSRPLRHQDAGQSGHPARRPFNVKEQTKERGYIPPPGGYLQSREGHYRDIIRR